MNQMKDISGSAIAKTAVGTYLTALALTIDMRTPALTQAELKDRVTELWCNLIKSIGERGTVTFALFAGLLVVNLFVERRREPRHDRVFVPLNFLIALVWLMGESFAINDTLTNLNASWGQSVKSVLYALGITYGLTRLTHLLYWFFTEPRLQAAEPPREGVRGRIWAFYERHTFRAVSATVFILWLPHLILSYPGNFIYDAYAQIGQYVGVIEFTSHHPPVATLIMCWIIELGWLISGNFGFFLYVLLQTLLFAAVQGYLFVLMRDLRAPRWLFVTALVMCAFVPYYTAFVGVVMKDTPYQYFLLLFSIELIYLAVKKEAFFRETRHVVLWVVSAIFVVLFRNNGKYVIYPTFALLAVVFFRRWTGEEGAAVRPPRRVIVRAVSALLVPVLLATGISAFVMRHYHVERGSIREALSLPFQQTARYVSVYEDEVTEEEREAIDAVLEYKRLARRYNPRISDAVKETFKDDATKAELFNYFKTWFRQFLRHPGVYFEATLNQNYYLLYPYIPNEQLYMSLGTFSDWEEQIREEHNIYEPEILKQAKEKAELYYRLCFRLPGLNMLSHPATYVTLLIWLIAFAIMRKKRFFLVAAFPFVLSVVCVILAPVIQKHARYIYHIIYAMPALLSYFLFCVRDEKTAADSRQVSAD